MLCTELPTLENGKAVLETRPDGKHGVALTYTIQPRATWGDGMPVTTDDVLFTCEVGRHPASGISNAELYRRIMAIDRSTTRPSSCTTTSSTFDYNAINDFRLLPAHLERPVFEADPADLPQPHALRHRSDQPRPGLRPLSDHRRSRRAASIVLERNPTWWGEQPLFDRIVVKAIENTAALEANLLSGEIDMIDGRARPDARPGAGLRAAPRRPLQVVYKPGLIYEHIDLKLDNPILADLRVRQALLYGLDRQAIGQRLFAGRQPVADTSVNPLDWVHTDDVRALSLRPGQGRAAARGRRLEPSRGGIRHNAQGEPLRLELMTTAGNRTRELVAAGDAEPVAAARHRVADPATSRRACSSARR